MTLSEDSALTVERFVQRLYHGRCELADFADVVNTDKCYMQLAELYVLADKYDVVRLHNHILDKLFEIEKADVRPPETSLVEFIYRHTTGDSAFRKLLVAHEAMYVDPDCYFDSEASESFIQIPEFAADVAITFSRRANGKYKSSFKTSASNLYNVFPTERETLNDNGGDKKPEEESSETIGTQPSTSP